MSLLNKLRKVARRGEAESSAVPIPQTDRRYHQRIPIADSGLVHVEIATKRFTLIDISYSGLAIRARDGNELPLGSSVEGRIVTPTGSESCGFMLVRTRSDESGHAVVGLMFENPTHELLAFLRDIIEPLRQASSLALVSKDHMKESRKDQGISYWRGEGPCDLEVHADHSFSLTFLLKNGQYGNVRLRDNQLSTSVTVGNSFSGVQQVVGTSDLSPGILQQGALILAGACIRHTELLPSLRALSEHASRLKAYV